MGADFGGCSSSIELLDKSAMYFTGALTNDPDSTVDGTHYVMTLGNVGAPVSAGPAFAPLRYCSAGVRRHAHAPASMSSS